MPGEDEGHKGFTVTDRRSVSADAGDGKEAPEAKPEPKAHEAAPPVRGEASQAMPHLDFGTFVMSLASSVLIHLGELGEPGGEAARPNLPLAKQTIDILGMLEEKTRGNLTDEEARLLQHLLYDLRIKFVDARRR
jgi:hypothetical protein